MISRALDSNNDIIIEKGSFKRVKDGAEVVQHVRTKLLFYRNEWFLDNSAGVPYFEEVFVKPVNLATAESILKTTILSTEGIDRLTEFEMDFSTTDRKLSVLFSAETVYGTINNEEVTINV